MCRVTTNRCVFVETSSTAQTAEQDSAQEAASFANQKPDPLAQASLFVYKCNPQLNSRAWNIYILSYLVFEAEDEGFEVYVNHLAHLLIGDVGECAAFHDSGVVEGYVQSSELLHRRIHHTLANGFLAVVIFRKYTSSLTSTRTLYGDFKM